MWWELGHTGFCAFLPALAPTRARPHSASSPAPSAAGGVRETLALLPANRLGLQGWGQPETSWHRGPLLQAGCPDLEALLLSKFFFSGGAGSSVLLSALLEKAGDLCRSFVPLGMVMPLLPGALMDRGSLCTAPGARAKPNPLHFGFETMLRL